MMLRRCLFAVSLLIVAVSPSMAQNQDYFRTFGGGSFRTAVFWSPFMSPFFGPGGVTDRVHFDLGMTPANAYTIADVNGLNQQLIVHEDSLVLAISDYEVVRNGFGVNASFVVSPAFLNLSEVKLTGTAGTSFRSVNTDVATSVDSAGTVIVDGVGFQWSNFNSQVVGANGDGSLLVYNGAVSNGSAIIAGGPLSTGSVEVIGGNSDWTSTQFLTIGLFGDGSLLIENGGSVSNSSAILGDIAGSAGSATVDGRGSSWTSFGELIVGDAGEGTLIVQDEAIVFSDDATIARASSSSATATISGENSAWMMADAILFVGGRGKATLNVNDGGQVVSQTGVLACEALSTGVANVNGSGSTWNSSVILFVGDRGTGVLEVENGGTVLSEFGIIGLSSGSSGTATITGQDSSLILSDSLCIGQSGNATLIVGDGGTLSCDRGTIGSESSATGTVTVDGADSIWTNAGELNVGENGSGALVVQNGATVSSSVCRVGRLTGSLGTATVLGENSEWEIAGPLSIGGDVNFGAGGEGRVSIGFGGSVTVDGETCLFPDGLLMLDSGSLTTEAINFVGGGEFSWSQGTLHVGTYDSDLLNESGRLAPGRSAGSTAIIGNYTQAEDATLEIEIGGTIISSEFDFVDVFGDAFLGGNLELFLIDGFAPSNGDSFTILNADNLIGFLDNVSDNQRLDTVDGFGSFLVRYGVASPNPSQIIISEFEPSYILGDVNGDGVVNLLDVGPFIDLISTGNFSPAADINMDGEVNLLDVALFVELLVG